MKKLLVMITALVGSFGIAKADITLTAGQTLLMQSIGSATNIGIGGNVAFGLSQDLGNGTTVTASGLSLAIDEDVADTDPGVDTDAFHQITFSAGGASLTYGADLEIDYADQGVGSVAGDPVSVGLGTAASSISLGNVEGNGISFASSFGGTAIKIGYLFKNSSGSNFQDTSASSLDTTAAFQVAVPVGPLSATIGYTADSSTASVTTMGASTSLAAGNGTLSLGYVNVDATADAREMSAAYATTLGAANLAVGYTSAEQGDDPTTTDIEVSLTQSVGNGASIFAELHNRTGVDSGETSAIVLGTSISF